MTDAFNKKTAVIKQRNRGERRNLAKGIHLTINDSNTMRVAYCSGHVHCHTVQLVELVAIIVMQIIHAQRTTPTM